MEDELNRINEPAPNREENRKNRIGERATGKKEDAADLGAFAADREETDGEKTAHAEDRGSGKKEGKKDKKKKKGQKWWLWPICAFFITLLLSAVFTLVSNSIITGSGVVVIILVLIVLLAISILFDTIGVAVAACDPTPFYSLASKKVRGAKMSLQLLKHADRVGSICNDIIGDICGVVSGACGATLVIAVGAQGSTMEFWVSVVISSLISAFTVGGKAFFKRLALTHSHRIISAVGKFLSFFTRGM